MVLSWSFGEMSQMYTQLGYFPGATIGRSQVIRMNFKNIVSGIWKLFVYGTGNGEKQYDIWLPISNFLKEETVFINPSSEQTVTSPGNAQSAESVCVVGAA